MVVAAQHRCRSCCIVPDITACSCLVPLWEDVCHPIWLAASRMNVLVLLCTKRQCTRVNLLLLLKPAAVNPTGAYTHCTAKCTTTQLSHLIKKSTTCSGCPLMNGNCLITSLRLGAFHTGPSSSNRLSAASMGCARDICSVLSSIPDSNRLCRKGVTAAVGLAAVKYQRTLWEGAKSWGLPGLPHYDLPLHTSNRLYSTLHTQCHFLLLPGSAQSSKLANNNHV